MRAAACIEYYFSLLSPYAWLGHAALLDVAGETGATLVYRPVRIFELFDANGGLPLGKRAPARQRRCPGKRPGGPGKSPARPFAFPARGAPGSAPP